MKSKSLIQIVVLCLVLGVLWIAAGAASRHFGLPQFASLQSGEDEEKALVQSILPALTEELNLDAPYLIDTILRFDEAVADTDNLRITYYNTFINLNTTDTDFDSIEERMPGAAHYMCNQAGVRKLMSYGVSFVYVYRAKDGVPVKTFTFVDDDC